MKKNAIIDIISNDIADIQLLISTFKGSENIPAAFLEMLRTKYEALGKEIALLDFWKTEAMTPQMPKAPEPTRVEPEEQPKVEPVVEAMPTAEPAEEPKAEAEPIAEPAKEELAEAARPAFEIPPIVMPEPIIVLPDDEAPAPAPVEMPKAEPMAAASKPEPVQHATSAADIKLYGTPVATVSRAFSINDRVLYQKELFGGDSALFGATLATIDTLRSYDEAHAYLSTAFAQWDENDKIVAEFFRTIHRRFI